MTKKELWELMSEDIEHDCYFCEGCGKEAIGHFIVFEKYEEDFQNDDGTMELHYLCKNCFIEE